MQEACRATNQMVLKMHNESRLSELVEKIASLSFISNGLVYYYESLLNNNYNALDSLTLLDDACIPNVFYSLVIKNSESLTLPIDPTKSLRLFVNSIPDSLSKAGWL